jgi:beta-glucosidase
LSWQGTWLPDSEFPGATTIGQALVAASMGHATLIKDNQYDKKPDVAIVIFGEDPYAEFQGDVPDLMFRDKSDNLALLQKFKAEGIKTVAVFLSGRPLWLNHHINAADAFVAAWLPGSEGGGVADILFGKADFKGKLSFSWPKLATQYVLNVGDKNYDPLFAYGYGLSYARPVTLGLLPVVSGLAPGADLPVGTWFERGKVAAGYALALASAGQSTSVETGSVMTDNGWLKSFVVDRSRQEDSRRFLWSGAGRASLSLVASAPVDLSREANGAVLIEIDYRVDAIGEGAIKLQSISPDEGFDVSAQLQASRGQGWQTLSLPLSCLAKSGVDIAKVQTPLSIATAGELDLTISRIALGTSGKAVVKC